MQINQKSNCCGTVLQVFGTCCSVILILGVLAGFGMYCYQINEFRVSAVSFESRLENCRIEESVICGVDRNATSCLPKIVECLDYKSDYKSENSKAAGMGFALIGIIPICYCLLVSFCHGYEKACNNDFT